MESGRDFFRQHVGHRPGKSSLGEEYAAHVSGLNRVTIAVLG
jgi:hypothetical protein